MTNKELIALCLRYGAANIDHLSEFLDPKDSDPEEPFDLEAIGNRLHDLALDVDEDFDNVVEVAYTVMACMGFKTAERVADLMDLSDAEMDRIVGVIMKWQNEEQS